MKTKRGSLLLILAVLFARPAAAATLDEVLAKHVEAQGGKARLGELKTLELQGKATFSGRGGEFSIDLSFVSAQKRPAMLRSEVSVQGLTAIQAWDGHEAWQVQPFQGRRDPERISADEARRFSLDADIDGPLVGAAAAGATLSYLGTEDVDGTPAHLVKVSYKNGDQQLVYLDPDYFLIIRVETHSFVRGAENVDETDYGSYEQVAGVWIPFSRETGSKGGPRTMKISIDRAVANAPVADALFSMPAKGPGAIDVPAASALPAGATAAAAGSSTPPPVRGGAGPSGLDSGVVSGLGARNIGSAAMSGRISAIAAYNKDGKTTLYVGAASGGVWKSSDGGTTFKPIFDDQPVQSIGAITLDPKNPEIVWVGTGEAWTRNSVSIGDGIYKSIDGGQSWANVGLRASERITKIVVDPRNSEVVYACAPGKLWSDSPERGLYKTTDGGKSWSLVLKGTNLSTGCSGVSLDPQHPDVVLAGLWDFRRMGWTFRSGGFGPEAKSGSGLWRSSDGGAHWTELTPTTSAGLPAKPYGRIEVTHAPSSGEIVYAFIEGVDSALFRSSDGGKTWEKRDKSQMMVWRPFYFARMVVDPKNPDRIFKTDLNLVASEDGGKSFSNAGGGGHSDWHDLWIDPDNTQHIVAGNDGGLCISFDGGNRWWAAMNLPISQFYHVSVDNRDPYRVYGGLQDNSSWVSPSAYPGGIENRAWENVGGGDGFWVQMDPTDAAGVYAESQGGFITRLDRETRAYRDIQPKAGYHEKLRFNWNTPLVLSPNDKNTVYLGAQFLFRTRDQGQSWERISPDLTTNDPTKQKQEESGGITVDNSAAETHTTIYSISESPRNAKVIWVGTDDGNVQLTRDGGTSWTNVVGNIKGLPKASWVSWVEASRHDEAVAYAAFDRHTFGDMAPYVYRTGDYGKTWTRVAGPEQGVRGYAWVVKEDRLEPSILFVGTELGLWITVDAGKSWAAFKGGRFPAVAVRDLAIQDRDDDLVIATHGRGIWIIDDLAPLRALSADVLARGAELLPHRPALERMNGMGGWFAGDAGYAGDNPAGGAVVTYYQRTRHLFGPIKVEIVGPDGKVVDTLNASKRRGINRVSWSMRLPPPRVPKAAQIAFSSTSGPRVLPGTYTVRLSKGAEVVTQPLEIRLDPRASYTAVEKQAQLDAVLRVRDLFGRMSTLVDRIELARATALALVEKAPNPKLAKQLRGVAEALDTQRKLIVATKEGGAITGEERLREHTDYLYGAIEGWEGRPGSYHVERIAVLERELDDVQKATDKVFSDLVEPLNVGLEGAGLPTLPTKAPEHAQSNLSSGDVQRAMSHFLGAPLDVGERFERD